MKLRWTDLNTALPTDPFQERTTMHGPDPNTSYPVPGHPRVGFLKPLIDRPNIEIGEYTYYDDPEGPEKFTEKCVLYHYPFIGDRLVIGKYCAIATGVRFIMNGANHAAAGFSTFPFAIFGNGWEAAGFPEGEHRGNTIVGNDVWIGTGAIILPGIHIADGAIIAAHAVVSRDVPAYGVVAGNPATLVKHRFPEDNIKRLVAIAWWDWPPAKVTAHVAAISGCDLTKLEAAGEQHDE
jgi:virginiamycin A acetyltransferase